MQRVRDLNIKPFGDNPPPTLLTPNMLVLAPQLAHKYPDVYNQELFNKSMDTYGPRWGMDRATVLKNASNTVEANQNDAGSAPQADQETAKRPNEDFTHNGIGYYRRNGQLYSAGSDDPNLELKVSPDVDAKIMRERAELQQRSEALKNRGDKSTNGEYLVAEKNRVYHYDRDGKLIAQFPFTSGQPGVTDSSIKGRGPIPPGEYAFNTRDIDKVHGLRYLWRRVVHGDWGHYYVRLHPAPDTQMYGRDGIYIHGGDTPGSAGCIDLGENDNAFFPRFQKTNDKIRLTVK